MKTFVSLALLTVVAAAQAGSRAVATSSVKATISADPALTLNSVTNGDYLARRQQASDPTQYYQFKPGVNLFDVDAFGAGDYVPVASTDATITYEDGTTNSLVGNVLSLTARADMTMASTPNTKVVADGFLGHGYYFKYTNGTQRTLSVTFDLEVALGTSIHADVPDGDAPYYVTDFANPTAFAGTALYTFDAQGRLVPGPVDSRVLDQNSSDPYTVDGTDSYQETYSRTYDVAPGESRVFEVYASADATTAHIRPVPEPAAFLPLGLGALALLRRRR